MKRNYTSVAHVTIDTGIALYADKTLVTTPLGNPVIVPNAALANAIAMEWNAQGVTVRKETMPMTQIAYIALDMVIPDDKKSRLFDDFLCYAETDPLCYRAGDVPDLYHEQAKLLDPIVAWAEERFSIALQLADGVMPVKQPEKNRTRLVHALGEYDNWKLAAIAASLGPLGSIFLALALVEGRLDAETAFALAHMEEHYETAKWGKDDEKEARLSRLQSEVFAAEHFLSLIASH